MLKAVKYVGQGDYESFYKAILNSAKFLEVSLEDIIYHFGTEVATESELMNVVEDIAGKIKRENVEVTIEESTLDVLIVSFRYLNIENTPSTVLLLFKDEDFKIVSDISMFRESVCRER